MPGRLEGEVQAKASLKILGKETDLVVSLEHVTCGVARPVYFLSCHDPLVALLLFVFALFIGLTGREAEKRAFLFY